MELNRPRLLHVFPTFDIGGAQRRFAQIAEATSGQFRHAVSATDGQYGARAIVRADIETLGQVDRSGNLFDRVTRYRRQLALWAPDLLLTYNWGAIEWALAGALAGIPRIHMEDGFGPEEADRQLLRRVMFRRLVLPRASAVVMPSRVLEGIALKTWRLPRKVVRYVPNGIDIAAAPPPAARDAARAEIGVPADARVVGWVGALRTEKNLGRLVRAFAKLEEDAILVVAGEGAERAVVEEEAGRLGVRSRLRLLGARKDIGALMPLFDVLALSSDTEQMPLVILEAMLAGLAIASVDVGDVAQMVAPENLPFICERTDEGLARAIASLLADEAARASIGRANRARVEASYPLDRMIRTYVGLFNGAIAGGRNASGAPEDGPQTASGLVPGEAAGQGRRA